MSLSLVQLHIRSRELARFAESQGFDSRHDQDQGYVCHALLQALFGELAPKPFRLQQRPSQAGLQQLLGYARESEEHLRECLAVTRSPLAAAAIDENLFAVKSMPQVWTAGRRYAIELTACPVVRLRSDGPEKDAFLAALDRNREVSREDVYLAWLARQFGEAADPEVLRLDGFQRIKMLRRTQDGNAHQRRLKVVERPRAWFSGIARVKSPESFGTLLARGIGRHRSFGYGMLMLRPAPS